MHAPHPAPPVVSADLMENRGRQEDNTRKVTSLQKLIELWVPSCGNRAVIQRLKAGQQYSQ